MKPGVDAAFRAILAHDRAHIRAPGPSTTTAAFRSALDAPLEAIVGDPVGEVLDFAVGPAGGTVPVRMYRPAGFASPGPLILFIHGGGFAAGSLATHDALCRALCLEAGMSVMSVGYRLAPEHPYPAAIDDCSTALAWVAAHGAEHGIDPLRLSICGDSAGGYLAVQACLAAGRGPHGAYPRHIGLVYPVVDPSCDTLSMHAFSDGYLLTRSAMQWFWNAFAGKPEERAAEMSLLRRDVSGLPPVSIITAELDPLRDEGALLAQHIIDAGGEASLRCYPGMVHGFASLPHVTPAATAAIRDLSTDINARIGGGADRELSPFAGQGLAGTR